MQVLQCTPASEPEVHYPLVLACRHYVTLKSNNAVSERLAARNESIILRQTKITQMAPACRLVSHDLKNTVSRIYGVDHYAVVSMVRTIKKTSV